MLNKIHSFFRNRRFVSTSDDKSLRVWEWNIPVGKFNLFLILLHESCLFLSLENIHLIDCEKVDMKYIADPSMHSMPCVTPSPNGKIGSS